MVPDHERRRLLAAGLPSPRSHRGRGLCSTCYEIARRSGAMLDHERLTVDTDSLLEDSLTLVVGRGMRRTSALARCFGMSQDAYTTTLRRAARAGDDRAIEIRSLLPGMRTA